jgi:tRNA 2-thiouridine synthesizing protein A
MNRRRARFFGRDPAPRRSDLSTADAGSGPSFSAERTVVSAPPIVPVLTIDALGRKCPIPIIMLAEQIRDVPLGAVVAVLADDPAAYTDVPSWCVMKAHEFVTSQDLPRGWALFIRRMVLAQVGLKRSVKRGSSSHQGLVVSGASSGCGACDPGVRTGLGAVLAACLACCA